MIAKRSGIARVKELLFLRRDQGSQRDQEVRSGKELPRPITNRSRPTKATKNSGEEVRAKRESEDGKVIKDCKEVKN